MPYRPQIDDHGVVARYKDSDTGEVITAKEYERRLMMQQGAPSAYPGHMPGLQQMPSGPAGAYPAYNTAVPPGSPAMSPAAPMQAQPGYAGQPYPGQAPGMPAPGGYPAMPAAQPASSGSSLIQPGAQILGGGGPSAASGPMPASAMPQGAMPASGTQTAAGADSPPTAGLPQQGKNLRIVGLPGHVNTSSQGYKTHGFLDATSIAILLPTMVLLALIIAAAHKKRLFPWQTIRTFNPPSGMMTPRDYERSFVCPPNLRRHGRLGKRNPKAAWTEQDGVVLPFGFLARTHLPITIPLGRLPNKNMFIVAPSGSGKTTLMRAIIKALMAKPCVIIALEAKANDPNLDEKREGFKYTVLPEAQQAGFETLYFNPLDADSVHWNPLDLEPITFASSICQDVNSLPPEEQHWAERDHGYISGLAQLLKWGAVAVAGEDEQGQPSEVIPLQSNPRGLMRLVNSRRNIVESLRRCKNNPNIPAAELSEMTQMLSSIIRTDTDWDKNIQGVRGRLRMFKNPGVLRVTDQSNIDIRSAMHRPTVLIFGAPASMGPDAESLASCFVYQLQQALHTRYGTKSVLPLFAFFDEYQTLNMDIAGRLSAIVRGANGGLTVILQNISQIAKDTGGNPTAGGAGELKTIFSNSAIRVCLHNSDESTAKFFSDEIGKHAVIVPGISDRYEANGFGIFPTAWNRIHSQQVVARVDTDSIKRMEKHHALVYLSPAGDPEFGEMKPFMCDLRGIEEIARLHLLHNVTGRPTNPAEAEQGGLIPGTPAPGMPVPAGMPAPAGMLAAVPGQAAGVPAFAKAAGGIIGNAVAAVPGAVAAMGPGGAPLAMGAAGAVAGVAAGMMHGAAQAAAQGPMSGAPQVAAGPMPAQAGMAGAGAMGAAAAMGAANAAKPPFPGAQQAPMGAPGTAPGAPVGGMQRPGVAAGMPPAPVAPTPAVAPAQVPAPAPSAPTQNGPATGEPQRLCTKCGKWPGKGRFCIECGTFVGQTAGAPGAPAAVAAPMTQPQPTAIPPAPGMPNGAPGQPQRRALTSLHTDLNQYGVPNAPAPGGAPAPQAPAQPHPQPGQQRMPRPQQRGTGIEF